VVERAEQEHGVVSAVGDRELAGVAPLGRDPEPAELGVGLGHVTGRQVDQVHPVPVGG
jgi:hypothetical protein